MCIRDSLDAATTNLSSLLHELEPGRIDLLDDELGTALTVLRNACLLYTSDAADERSSVDLGGRRIIKKKKSNTTTKGLQWYTNKKTQK